MITKQTKCLGEADHCARHLIVKLGAYLHLSSEYLIVTAVKWLFPFLEEHLILGGVSLGFYSLIAVTKLNKTAAQRITPISPFPTHC